MASAGRRPRAAGIVSRFRELTVGAKLLFFSTLLTIAAVSLAFFVLSVSLERHTKHRLAETLSRHGQTLTNLQQRSLDELLRISTLMTDSPTLRAAMETFATESSPSRGVRSDLLATIQNEADKVAQGLGRDLLLVTDRNGRVLAAAGPSGRSHEVGEDLSSRPIVKQVLEQDDPLGARNFTVLPFGDEYIRVGCAPIVLRGFIIGTLVLGDRIDRGFVERLRQSFDCDVTVRAGPRVLASTLPGSLAPTDARPPASKADAEPGAPWVVRLAGEDYVAAALDLGSDGQGHDVRLYLLNSLTKNLGDSNSFLFWILISCGSLAVLGAGLAGFLVSRSVLRPLESFVAFMREVASTGDHARRFDDRVSCVEVETLNEAYNHLMESLLEHERRLIQNARYELDRLERLKESEKLAALGRMLSGAAHEINNPLTGVIGNVDMMLRGDRLDADTRARLEKVKREGQRVSALVRHLLKISHRDTGEKTVVDLHALLRDAVDVRRHDFVRAGMTLALELPDTPIRVMGSELELHQVFLNIINNAYDALKEIGQGGRVTIAASVDDGRVLVVFADNGPGMKNPKQVFDHFYTTKPVGSGTGLGLSISYAVVDQHGGRIVAENAAEGGARFTVELPIALARGDAQPKPAAPRAPAPAEPSLHASVLIVDDEPSLVDLQRDIFEALGAVVVGAGSGVEAIEHLRRQTFDLIVTDMRMPGGVSGEDLFRWVESNSPESKRGFVFVTGDNAEEGCRDFVTSVGARCVMKPFSLDEYVKTMRDTFGETRHGA